MRLHVICILAATLALCLLSACSDPCECTPQIDHAPSPKPQPDPPPYIPWYAPEIPQNAEGLHSVKYLWLDQRGIWQQRMVPGAGIRVCREKGLTISETHSVAKIPTRYSDGITRIMLPPACRYVRSSRDTPIEVFARCEAHHHVPLDELHLSFGSTKAELFYRREGSDAILGLSESFDLSASALSVVVVVPESIEVHFSCEPERKEPFREIRPPHTEEEEARRPDGWKIAKHMVRDPSKWTALAGRPETRFQFSELWDRGQRAPQ